MPSQTLGRWSLAAQAGLRGLWALLALAALKGTAVSQGSRWQHRLLSLQRAHLQRGSMVIIITTGFFSSLLLAPGLLPSSDPGQVFLWWGREAPWLAPINHNQPHFGRDPKLSTVSEGLAGHLDLTKNPPNLSFSPGEN